MSSPPAPKRRFLPEPVETTVKSSRKFAPEPVETTQRSSRKLPEPIETTTKSIRRFAPEPVETTSKSSRKFALEPVETTQRSTRKFNVEPVETTAKSSRRFAPEPIETKVTSSRDKPASETNSRPVRRFAPETVETSTRSSRNRSADVNGGAAKNGSNSSNSEARDDSTPRPRRKFAPQLIETAKRSRKAGDEGPAIREGDRTEATPEGTRSPGKKHHHRPPAVPLAPVNTPNISMTQIPKVLEARRLGIPLNLRRSDSVGSNRSHSFRVPDLDTIESSESEEEGPRSPSTSSSVTSDLSVPYNHATRRRESVDERFAGFMLEIAAKAAEKQMREQAMAAFPNDDHHEPVAHFIDDDEAISDEPEETDAERRESFTKVNWELLAMQKHVEEKARQEQEQKKKVVVESKARNPWGDPWASPWGEPKKSPWGDAVGKSPYGDPVGKSPWGNPAGSIFSAQRGRPEEREMQQMQRGARPPMLGGDIKFPRCPSPEPARFDVTQGSEAIRESMCYLTQQSHEDEHQGLWGTTKSQPHSTQHSRKHSRQHSKPHNKQHIAERNEKRAKPPSLWSNPGSSPPSRGGLWNGLCFDNGQGQPNQQTGMLTPCIEMNNPFDSPPPTPAKAPPSPPRSNPDWQSIDEKLNAEQALQAEFNDAFVTQVYNYLSLGYPSLARKFDDELSKISRIPVADLRQDDELARSRGYIRLGEDKNVDLSEDTCARWRALKVYIFEWAKQQPRMVPAGHALGGFGVAARRGSWAW